MSEVVIGKESDDTSDLIEVSGNIVTRVNWKVSALLFIICVVVFSDLFVETFLEGTALASGDNPTNDGTFVQIFTVIGGYILADLAVSYGVV